MLESREMAEQTDWRAKTRVDLLSWTCSNGVKGNDSADRLVGNDSCESTVLDMLESREMAEQTDWWAKQPSQAARAWDDLKSWGFLRHYTRVQSQGHHTIDRLEGGERHG